jgi:hypothetical protein
MPKRCIGPVARIVEIRNEYIFVKKRNGRYRFEETVGQKLLKIILKKRCSYSCIEAEPRGRVVSGVGLRPFAC